MLVEHELSVVARCPVDGRLDLYRLTVRASRVVRVEDILEAVAAFADREVYQEDIAVELHRELAAEVELVGEHSGVRTRVRVGGNE